MSLSVEDRECLVILGPSGSGKTTALRLIAGLETPTAGTIAIGDRVVNGLAAKHRDVAMVFQTPALYPHMSVYENLAFGLRLRGCPRHERDQRVGELADMLGLARCLTARPAELSGGQRQRVALGRALARRASVLLLDEPLANIDPNLRSQMRAEILSLGRRYGTTMIYVTHDHLEAMMLGDRIAVLGDGVLQQVASPSALYLRPANLFVARFVGAPPMNLFQGSISGGLNDRSFELCESPAAGSDPGHDPPVRLYLEAGLARRLEAYLSRPIVLGLRPEQITCGLGGACATPGPVITAKVLSASTAGADTYVRACAGGTSFVARIPSSARVENQRDYAFSLNLAEASYFDRDTGKAIP